MSRNMEVGSYFYPLTQKCEARKARAGLMGHNMVDETELQAQAGKLFSDHDQPRQYCLGENKQTRWDDSNQRDMARQLELATTHGLDFFIFDTYLGRKKGVFRTEMTDPLNNAFLKLEESKRLKFATMLVFGSPRVVLPVPPVMGFEEPDRYYDTDFMSVKYIVDYCMHNYWNDQRYLNFHGRPYVSIFTSDLSLNGKSKESVFRTIVGQIKDYAHKHYGVDPYVVGVVRKVTAAQMMVDAGVDALTGYAFLAEFGQDVASVQDYSELVSRRQVEWEQIHRSISAPFVPPAVTGWDASPRGLAGYDLESVQGCYPYTPIVTGSNANEFGKMLEASLDHTSKFVPKGDQYGLVTAWNEITEGAALLPRLIENVVDFSYLEAFRDTVSKHNNK